MSNALAYCRKSSITNEKKVFENRESENQTMPKLVIGFLVVVALNKESLFFGATTFSQLAVSSTRHFANKLKKINEGKGLSSLY